jgi:hypothetical protein
MNRRFLASLLQLCGIPILTVLPLFDSVAALRLYFVAVGSSVYLQTSAPGYKSFNQLDAMNHSARVVSERLRRSGSSFGVLLLSNSEKGLAVGLPDIDSAIERIKSVIHGVLADDAMVIFYYAGHGISEGIAWNHFSVPGNLVYRGRLSELSIEELSKKTLYAATLADTLDNLGAHYLVLLDTCYEGTAASFDSPVLTGEAIRNLRDGANALKFLNEFHQPNPVIFSTAPGTTVTSVTDPSNSSYRVGPLARRLLLALDDGKVKSLQSLIKFMTAAGSDGATSPAVTYATSEDFWSRPLFGVNPSTGAVEEVRGTAKEIVECGSNSEQNLDAIAKDTRNSSERMYGRIEISGSPGEYLTDGRERSFLSDADQFLLEEELGKIRIDVNSGSWEIDLSTSDGRPFTARRYAGAQRDGFADSGHPGMSVSGEGHGCNEIAGEFTIRDISYKENRLVHLSAIGIQHCDGSKKNLQIDLDLWNTSVLPNNSRNTR